MSRTNGTIGRTAVLAGVSRVNYIQDDTAGGMTCSDIKLFTLKVHLLPLLSYTYQPLKRTTHAIPHSLLSPATVAPKHLTNDLVDRGDLGVGVGFEISTPTIACCLSSRDDGAGV